MVPMACRSLFNVVAGLLFSSLNLITMFTSWQMRALMLFLIKGDWML
jgi:hypothetical protein